MDAKSILASKTFWLNLVVVPLGILALHFGVTLDPTTETELAVVLASGANIAMRFYTSQPVTLLPPVTLPKPILLLAILLGGATSLSACSTTGAGPTMAQLCPVYQAAYPTLAASQDAKTQNLMAFASSLCDPKTGAVLPVPAAADPSTPAWYADVLAGLKLAVAVAALI